MWIMQRLQAYKYEILPNGEQQRRMRRFAGSCRFVFNQALALQKERYERGERKIGYAGLCTLLTQWRNGTETPWLADAPTHPLQQALKDLERAYQNFFARRAHFPRFKRKGQCERFRYPDPQQFKVDQSNSRLFLPKLGWLRYRNSREMLGVAKNIWFEFRRQLEYKLNWAGGQLVAVPPHHTSVTCPACDYVAAQNRTSQAKFKCVRCDYENHADVVGAINVLARGYRVIACGEEGAGSGHKTRTKPSSVKQEPAEATMREVDHA
jgi:transposase